MERFILEHNGNEDIRKQLTAFSLYQRYTVQETENVVLVNNACHDEQITEKLNIICEELGLKEPIEVLDESTEFDELKVKKWPKYQNNTKYGYSVLSKKLREVVAEKLS